MQQIDTTTSLEGLQTEEQRLVLDTIAQIRKCGLESVLSLPQLVVCGDQSAGKSSVLEALTEIPFPRNDNLCTRFATEIILRRATTSSLIIKVIPGPERTRTEQEAIKAFNESITDLAELPALMNKAMAVMGIDSTLDSNSTGRAFARDVLSIEIENPTTPQLTLVDLPGLIQNETKGVTKADVDLVTEITDHYISQPRTICLAVVAATNDYANQGILSKVRKVDPAGERTLGIITKPDRLPAGSGSEQAYLALARNDDVFFKLGWHVLKNRSFEEGASTFWDRNMSEANYFRTSNFKTLPKDDIGIGSLRTRLSRLLFNHVKQELPKLREDLDRALHDTKGQLSNMGNRRATAQECRAYMTQLSQDCYQVCKAAADGHYEGEYFSHRVDPTFSLMSPFTVRRLRACIQVMNSNFNDALRLRGYKYHIARFSRGEESGDSNDPRNPFRNNDGDAGNLTSTEPLPEPTPGTPIKLTNAQALNWVGQALIRTRGRELSGEFNPLLVGELFWEQSSNWHNLAVDHVDEVSQVCSQFLQALLEDKCPKDIRSRLWSSQIQDSLKSRYESAIQELDRIVEDARSYPINYNHYYTDIVEKMRKAREQESLKESIEGATVQTPIMDCNSQTHYATSIDVDKAMKSHSQRIDPDMHKVSCQKALDCLFAIYKVSTHLPIALSLTDFSPPPSRSLIRPSSQMSRPKSLNATSSAGSKTSSPPLQ